MLTPLLSLLVLCTTLLLLRGEYRGPRSHVYVFKPLSTLLILAIALLDPDPVTTAYQRWIVLGLAFSLAGDVFLMLPSDRFVAGLVSFLLAHLCYIAAFLGAAGLPGPTWRLLPFALYAPVLLRTLLPHTDRFRIPVIVYGLTLLVMAWLACERWVQTDQEGAVLAFAGAVLFVLSDTMLAFNRFVKTFAPAQALVLSTYFAAQWLIALSI